MELWEGAIIVGGGALLVWYMSQRNAAAAAAAQPTVIGSTSTARGSIGTTNLSNLTTITNTAGGVPTIAGESIVPYRPPLGMPSISAYRISTGPVYQALTPHASVPSNIMMRTRPISCLSGGCGAHPIAGSGAVVSGLPPSRMLLL